MFQITKLSRQDLSEEALMVVHLLNKEFELNGIFLESSQRREVVKLQSQISLLESTFMANLYQQQQQHTLGLQGTNMNCPYTAWRQY